jgi:hypothetical protein
MLTAWLSFLKDPVQMDGAFLDDQYVRKAMDTLMYISSDDEVRAMADLRQKTINDYNSEMTVAREEGLAEGEAIGIAKGIAKAKEEGLALMKETARSMLAEGMSPEAVSRCTKLPIEDVLVLVVCGALNG